MRGWRLKRGRRNQFEPTAPPRNMKPHLIYLKSALFFCLQIGRLFTALAGLPSQSTEPLLSPPLDTDTEQEQKEQQHEGSGVGTGAGAAAGGERSLIDYATGACMIGVDISAKMAQLAFRNGGYSVTLCADLDAVLQQFFRPEHEHGQEQISDKSSGEATSSTTSIHCGGGSGSGRGSVKEGGGGGGSLRPLDLLVAADTFLYVGPLEEVRRMV